VADRSQRTEKPTQRRLDRARREGHFPVSREFVAAFQFLACVALAVAFAGNVLWAGARLTRRLLAMAFSVHVTQAGLVVLFRDLAYSTALPLCVWGGSLVLMILLAQVLITRFGISWTKLAPDVKRLNPASRIKSLPGQTLPAFVQAMLLLPVVGLLIWWEIRDNLDSLLELAWLAPQPAVTRIAGVLAALLWRVAGFFLAVGVVDLLWQRRRHRNHLRMSKQEIREEAKEQEASPHVKMRIRRIQRDLARRQMMKEISKATAVIVNPTHYAVAIRYSMESSAAPRIVAKGKNYLAQRIRTRAIEHQVPIVENPPLARALYNSADVGQEIPAHLYRAVAEILAYIYRLMNGRLPG
jgi:flagellar biosynthetic protein FlhB